MSRNRHPVAVLISDIHYSLSNLLLADAALRKAIEKAAELRVSLTIAGDLHDTKANLRGECVRAMIDTFSYAGSAGVRSDIIVGNHDLINERGKDNSLEFLKPYSNVVHTESDGFYPTPGVDFMDVSLIPYQHDPAEFQRILSEIPKNSTIICHQGVTGAESGEYIYDKSAVNKELLADYRVISGHYHRAQHIKCGRPRKGSVGLMSYIGSPYTITYAEAFDGPKGFQILYSDGTLEQVPTNIRKHVIWEATVSGGRVFGKKGFESPDYNEGDLLWVKLTGSKLELQNITKQQVAIQLKMEHRNFRFDPIATDCTKRKSEKMQKAKYNSEIMDLLIDESEESASDKTALKDLYRKVMS